MSFNYKEIDDEVSKKISAQSRDDDHVWVTPVELPPNFPLKDQSPQACCLSNRYKEWAEKIKNFEVFEDDVWVVTYPKSGTTWTQEMVYLLKNNLDYEKAAKTSLNDRFPFFEMEAVLTLPPGHPLGFESSLNQPRPRLIKTHLPIQLLPDAIWTVNPKIIYVYRQPKDVAVSYYHHYCTLHGYQGGLQLIVDALVKDLILWSPYHEHISGFLQLSEINKKNVLLTRYEDMKKDLPFQIMRTSKFLGVEYTEVEILKLADHLSIENMKKNPSVNMENELKFILSMTPKTNENNDNLQFIRKGEVGGWKNDLSLEMSVKIDEWSNKKVKKDKYLKKYL